MFRKRFGSFRLNKENAQAQTRKNLSKEDYRGLREALSPKISSVVTHLAEKKAISERKEENILCLPGVGHKTQFLLDIIKTKGTPAIEALYDATLTLELWDAADIIEPTRAPHDPKKKSKAFLASDGTDRPSEKPFKHTGTLGKQVSWQDEEDVPPGYQTQDFNEKVAHYLLAQKEEPTDKDGDQDAADGTINEESDDIGSEHDRDTLNNRVMDDSNDEKQNGETMEKESDNGIDQEREVQPYVESSLPIVVERAKSKIEWRYIPGLNTIKESLTTAVFLPIRFPHLFTGQRKPLRNFLLFGADINLHYLARAVADETGSSLVSVSSFDLVSTCSKEGVMETVFEHARSQKPSVVFINEINAICQDDPAWLEQIKVSFMDQISGEKMDNDGILVLAATSKPWDLDSTLLAKFDKKIHCPLPLPSQRAELLKEHLASVPNYVSDAELEELGQETNGYSGTDIEALVRNSTMQPIRKVQQALFFRTVSGPSREDPNLVVHDLLTPCSPGSPGAMEMSWVDVPSNKLMEPLVTKHDILFCISNSKPTSSEEDETSFHQFMQNMGIES